MNRKQAERLKNELEQFFVPLEPRYRLESTLGSGAVGMAFKIAEYRTVIPVDLPLPAEAGASQQLVRRLVIKRAFDHSLAELRREIDTLRNLNGAVHIIGILAHRDDAGLPDAFTGNGDWLIGLLGPVLVLDYLENGTLRQLVRRAGQDGMPNRMLWTLYECLVRACIGMAYPMGWPLGFSGVVEELPGASVQPDGYAHRDMHLDNVMIGRTDESIAGHSRIPITKLIDFGEAVKEGQQDEMMAENLLAVATIMYAMMVLEVSPVPVRGLDQVMYGELLTHAEILDDQTQRDVPDFVTRCDDAMKTLIARSLAVDPAQRPSLAETLAMVTEGAASCNEEPQVVKDFVQNMIYDPPRPDSTP